MPWPAAPEGEKPRYIQEDLLRSTKVRAGSAMCAIIEEALKRYLQEILRLVLVAGVSTVQAPRLGRHCFFPSLGMRLNSESRPIQRSSSLMPSTAASRARTLSRPKIASFRSS